MNIQPNPFIGQTSLHYSISESSYITFKVYDNTGRLVLENNPGVFSKGEHSSLLNLQGMPKGIYVCSLNINGNRHDTKRMVVN